MRTELHSTARVRRPERNDGIGIRLVETPVHRAARLRQQRKQQDRENRVMAALCGVVGFGMTLVGLYVNAHSALNTRERLASRLAVDNIRLNDRLSAIETEADGLEMTLTVPSPEVLKQMGLEYSKSPNYLGRSTQGERR